MSAYEARRYRKSFGMSDEAGRDRCTALWKTYSVKCTTEEEEETESEERRKRGSWGTIRQTCPRHVARVRVRAHIWGKMFGIGSLVFGHFGSRHRLLRSRTRTFLQHSRRLHLCLFPFFPPTTATPCTSASSFARNCGVFRVGAKRSQTVDET